MASAAGHGGRDEKTADFQDLGRKKLQQQKSGFVRAREMDAGKKTPFAMVEFWKTTPWKRELYGRIRAVIPM